MHQDPYERQQRGYAPRPQPQEGWGQQQPGGWEPPERQPGGWGQQPPPGYYHQGPPQPRNGLGIAAIILGLVGLLLGLVPLTAWLGVISGITGAALGLAAIGRVRRGQATNKKTTYAGVGASGLAVVVGIVGVVLFFSAVDQLGDDLDELGQDLESLGGDAAPAEGAAGTDPAAGGPAPAPDNPIPAGQLVAVGDWAVAMQPANLDAESAVRSPAAVPEGYTYVMARADVRYDGDGSEQPWLDLRFQILGADGVTYDQICGVDDEFLSRVGEMFPGATSAGNVCVAAPADQLEGAVWTVRELADFDDTSRVFIALQ